MMLDLNMFNLIIGFFVFLIGACIGSFLNVVIYRVPLKISIIMPRSHCPSCQNTIPFLSLVPILGFFLNLGKCKYCKNNISFQYPLVELLAGLGTLFLFEHNPSFFPLLVSVWLFYTGIVLSFIDLKYRILPDIITIPGVFIGFLISVFNPQMGFVRSLVGIFFGFFCLLLISKLYEILRKRDGMGMGDVKYLGFIGAVIGWDGVVFTLFIASILGSLFGIALGFYYKKYLSIAIPFGPFLAFAALIVSVWKNALIGFFF